MLLGGMRKLPELGEGLEKLGDGWSSVGAGEEVAAQHDFTWRR